MATNNDSRPASPTERVESMSSSVSETLSTESQDYPQKEEQDNEATRTRSETSRRSVLLDDVAIPAGILRAANRNWAPDTEDPEKAAQQQPEDFSILDIALEQRQQIGEALGDSTGDRAYAQHMDWDLEAGVHRNQWRNSTLQTLEEGTRLDDSTASPRRWSASRLAPVRTLSSATARRRMSALPAAAQNDAVLFRSLDGYKMNNDPATRNRPLSEIPPDADYFGVFGDIHEIEEESPQSPGAAPTDEANESRTQKARRTALERLCLRGRNESVVGPIQAVKQGAADLARRNSLYDVYEKAKVRGQHLQRKRWVQLLFEYTFYLIILCFVYFVLVGRPIWNGAVWWLYWVVNNKFTVAGTWSVTIGLGLFYAYAPLLILFEKEPPMPAEHDQRPEPAQPSDPAGTALLIPCYKSAQIIGPTLAAALKIFPAKDIFVIANGNSPTPLDETEEVCRGYGVNHVWSPVGSKIVAQYVGCYAAKKYTNVLLIDDDCALPANFPIVSDRLKDKIKCIGYTIKSVGPNSTKGTMCQQAQDLEYKISGLQRDFAGKIGSATFPHGAISLWNTSFLIDTFRTHPGFSVSEDWFFGHAARKLGSRVTMCSQIFVETETPTAVLFSSGGARGGFGEMTIFKQRFYRWNFFFVNGMFYNMAYIFGSWKLGFWEIGTKIFVFQEVYETLLYLLAPFVLPISLIVRPVFCIYLLIATIGMYFINVTIFNEVHLRRRNERVGWVCVYLYYTPYKILLTVINVFSCYYSLYKYAKYFAKRHPKIIEDEKTIEVVLRLEETAPATEKAEGGGRRLTVTAVGARLSMALTRNSRLSTASTNIPTADLTNPAKVHIDRRSRGSESLDGGRPRPCSQLSDIQRVHTYQSDTFDFARTKTRDDAQ